MGLAGLKSIELKKRTVRRKLKTKDDEEGEGAVCVCSLLWV